MPHYRSPSKMAEGRKLVVEGEVCRESNVAGRLVNKRWMQLFGPSGTGEPPLLASFRHRGDSEPSKLWEITRSCSVSEVESGTFNLRSETSTLVAVVAGRYREVEMVSRLGVLPPLARAFMPGAALQASSNLQADESAAPQLLHFPRSSLLRCTLATVGCSRRRACACASTTKRPLTSGTASWRQPSAAWSA